MSKTTGPAVVEPGNSPLAVGMLRAVRVLRCTPPLGVGQVQGGSPPHVDTSGPPGPSPQWVELHIQILSSKHSGAGCGGGSPTASWSTVVAQGVAVKSTCPTYLLTYLLTVRRPTSSRSAAPAWAISLTQTYAKYTRRKSISRQACRCLAQIDVFAPRGLLNAALLTELASNTSLDALLPPSRGQPL